MKTEITKDCAGITMAIYLPEFALLVSNDIICLRDRKNKLSRNWECALTNAQVIKKYRKMLKIYI